MTRVRKLKCPVCKKNCKGQRGLVLHGRKTHGIGQLTEDYQPDTADAPPPDPADTRRTAQSADSGLGASPGAEVTFAAPAKPKKYKAMAASRQPVAGANLNFCPCCGTNLRSVAIALDVVTRQ